MSYTITKTDGTALSTANMPGGSLLDGTTDSSTGVTLIGRNFPNYGDAQNENFVRLLENFADNVPPTQSLSALNILVGSIWYDTNIKKIRVYDGTNWNPASSTIVANLAPTSATYTIGVGDQWWDTVNNQLNAWTGNVWMLVGPDRAGFARVETELQSNVALINANVTQLRIDTGNYMTANVATLNSTIGQLRVDTGNYMTANVAAINATILSVQNGINANVNSLSISTTNSLNTLTSNATTQQTSINSINATLLTLAPLASPALTGTPTAPTALANNNTTQIATTAYVDASALVLSTDYNSKISNEVTARNSAIATATSTLANISSPTFTGTPTAPTATSGDNSTKLATTAFVTQAVAASGMHYTVSSSAPSGGNNGDFWFQV